MVAESSLQLKKVIKNNPDLLKDKNGFMPLHIARLWKYWEQIDYRTQLRYQDIYNIMDKLSEGRDKKSIFYIIHKGCFYKVKNNL